MAWSRPRPRERERKTPKWRANASGLKGLSCELMFSTLRYILIISFDRSLYFRLSWLFIDIMFVSVSFTFIVASLGFVSRFFKMSNIMYLYELENT